MEAVAIFAGKRERQTLPEGVDARYLLGIVRNLDHLHESEAITEALIKARLEARDILLQPLVAERDEILHDHSDATALRAFVDHALATDPTVDRSFWIQAAADPIGCHPDGERGDLFREAARRIHATFAAPGRERSAAERDLARLVWPLS